MLTVRGVNRAPLACKVGEVFALWFAATRLECVPWYSISASVFPLESFTCMPLTAKDEAMHERAASALGMRSVGSEVTIGTTKSSKKRVWGRTGILRRLVGQ